MFEALADVPDDPVNLILQCEPDLDQTGTSLIGIENPDSEFWAFAAEHDVD
jgi:hypothetical protein